jgi:peroxiredoxin
MTPPKTGNKSVLIWGIASPFAGLFLYGLVYSILTRISADRTKDWLFRLSLSTLAMTVPMVVTFALALKQRRQGRLSGLAIVGLSVAILSLILVARPVRDGIARSKQTRNLSLHDVAAPLFATTDIQGNPQRLADYKGQVVLVNIWATWCGPCRHEMPGLDDLYREKKSQGFVVFGISNESIDVQKQFLTEVPVSYPLLTEAGQMPAMYRDIAQYPAIFLIDRQGRLQPAPSPEQPFSDVEDAVDALLQQK